MYRFGQSGWDTTFQQNLPGNGLLLTWYPYKFAAILQTIFLKRISSIKIVVFYSQTNEFSPKGPVNDKPVLVQIMACRLFGDKPLSEPMVALLTGVYMRHLASVSRCSRLTKWYLETTTCSLLLVTPVPRATILVSWHVCAGFPYCMRNMANLDSIRHRNGSDNVLSSRWMWIIYQLNEVGL